MSFVMDENKKCEKICVCFKCTQAVDAGGTCRNCEDCIARENAKGECSEGAWEAAPSN